MKKNHHFMGIITFLLIIFVLVFTTAHANVHFNSDDDRENEIEPGIRVDYHPQTGKLNFLGANPARPILFRPAMAFGLLAEDRANSILQQFGSLFGLNDVSTELRLMKQGIRVEGGNTTKYQQLYMGIPVIAGELVVNINDQGGLISINGEISPDLTLETSPSIQPTDATSIAVGAVASWYEMDEQELQATKPELWIYDARLLIRSTRPPQLVWRFNVSGRDRLDVSEFVLVDAHSGGIPLHFSQIHTAKNRATYDANNLTILPGTLRCNESNPNCSGGDSHEVAAHVYAGNTYDFYWNYHGRDSINDAGMTIVSTVHYGFAYENAFWNGSQMVYGDGAGFPLADDVVAHELTHGVTQYESGLFYYYESGAINESLSDIWGEFVDQTNLAGNDSPAVKWLIGEDVAGWAPLRDMAHPPNKNDPDKMTSIYYHTLEGDYPPPPDPYDVGGVHTNSGVNNKAAYLMTDGDTFNGKTITGLGITKVAAIYYEVQTNYLTSGSGYGDLYNYLLQACLNLVGGSEGITESDCVEVREATDAVEMNQEPSVGFNPEAEVCSAGFVESNLFFDDMESGSGNWVSGVESGEDAWYFAPQDYIYTSSGVAMLYGWDGETNSDSYAAMVADVTLPGGSQPFLRFNHSFGFDQPNMEGGWLEYSTNSGSSWSDAGSFFNDGRDYTGTISGSGSNPNPSHQAFIGDSHGYVSSRYDLSSLAGQDVRFRWRVSIDNEAARDLGWVVDDVQIYTCNHALFLPLATK